MTAFRNDILANGIAVEFSDVSNRYFGDYHRVRVVVRLLVSRPDREQPLVKVHTLERMGVPGAEVEAVRNRLAEDYWQHAGRYLAHPDYPARLRAAEAASSSRRQLAGFRADVP
jgi:hypothetical protein